MTEFDQLAAHYGGTRDGEGRGVRYAELDTIVFARARD